MPSEVFQQNVSALCKARLAHGTESCMETRENLCCFSDLNSLHLYTCVITSIQKGCLILIWQPLLVLEVCCTQDSEDSPLLTFFDYFFKFQAFKALLKFIITD